LKLTDKPGFVGLIAKADSHSSRRTITDALKQPTRWQREPRLLPAYLILLQMEVTAFHVHCGVPQFTRLCGPIPRLILLPDFSVRPLAVILLYAARTFLSLEKTKQRLSGQLHSHFITPAIHSKINLNMDVLSPAKNHGINALKSTKYSPERKSPLRKPHADWLSRQIK